MSLELVPIWLADAEAFVAQSVMLVWPTLFVPGVPVKIQICAPTPSTFRTRWLAVSPNTRLPDASKQIPSLGLFIMALVAAPPSPE